MLWHCPSAVSFKPDPSAQPTYLAFTHLCFTFDLLQMYGVLTSSTGKDLSAVFKSDLNVGESKNYNVVVKPYSRDFQTCIKKVTELAILGYCLKDDL
jgi:hypothetical protein